MHVPNLRLNNTNFFSVLVQVSPLNSTTVSVSWNEVRCFNGSGTVTHYLVQYHSICSGSVHNVTTDGTVQNISGLTPNNAVYTFQVVVVGTNQMIGPFSNPANISVSGKCSKSMHMYMQ